MARKRRPVLKKPPLRNPGQSLQEQLNERVFENVLVWFMGALVFVLLAALEWWRWYAPVGVHPVGYTLMAVAACAIAAWRIWKAWPGLRNIAVGIEGEKAVGQWLEETRPQGYRVFHDIPGDGYNVDHVMVGAAGVFAIETKTARKPVGRACEVVYDGKQVTVDGHLPDRDPIAQVKAAAAQVRDIIEQFTGRKVPVRPVVLYPEWFVRRGPRGADVWVLNEKALPGFIEHEDPMLSDAEVHLVAGALEMYVRNYQKRP